MVQKQSLADRSFRSPRRRHLVEAVALALGSLFAGEALSNPQIPTVVNGQVSFAQQGKKLTITNSNGAIINWGSFSIGAGETTQFVQSGPGSEVLNRVTGGDPSIILGQLLSNGRVFLINPNGIAFGPGAQVDVGSLVVSTLSLSNGDFIAGRLNFAANKSAAGISNAGSISAGNGGTIYLVAPQIANSGVIVAPNGEIMLAAGASVNLVDASNPALSVEIDAPANQVINLGRMVARGVSVYGSIVQQSGVVEATGASRGAGGEIVLSGNHGVTLAAGSTTAADGTADGGTIAVAAAEGVALVSGTVSANGSQGSGGAVTVTGQDVGLSGAHIAANGAAGGGTIHIGGGSRGADAGIQDASATFVDSTSSLSANAATAGSGGSIVVYSSGMTRVYGSLSAAGGASIGDGGSIETSGHFLDLSGTVNVDAPHGHAGRWLLDPYDVTISVTGPDTNTSGAPNFTANGNDAVVTTGSIQTALNGGAAVTVSTGSGGTQTGNITVSSPITMTGSSAASLTLSAYNNIAVNQNITATGSGALSVTLAPNGGATGGTNTIAATIGSAAAGGVLTLSGASSLASGGGVQNMTIAGAGPLTSSFGTLTNVTLNENLAITNQLNLGGTLTLGAGHSISFGPSATMTYAGATTIGGSGSILIGNTAGANYIQGSGGGSPSLVLGSGIVTNVTGLTEFNGSVTNQGTINQSGTSILYLGAYSGDSFTNAAGANVAVTGGTVNLGYNNAVWDNLGTIGLSGGALTLGGTFTPTTIGTITRGASGTVTLTGTLNNTGHTTDLSVGGPVGLVDIAGTIVGGTLANTNAGSNNPVMVTATSTFTGVTLNQDVDVQTTTLYIGGGLTFANGHALSLTGNDGVLNYTTSGETIGGTGTINFATTSTSYLQPSNGGASLTLGSGVTTNIESNTLVNGSVTNLGHINESTSGVTGYLGYYSGDDFVNGAGGVISVSAGTLAMGGSQATWDNSAGTINATGGTLDLAGNFTTAALGSINRTGSAVAYLTGSLNNAGATVDLSSTGPYGGIVLSGGTITGGTLQAQGSATTAAQTAGTSYLNGVTLNQDLNVTQGTLDVSNGLVFANGHTLTLGTSSNASLTYIGNESFTGTGNLTLGTASGFTYLEPSGAATLTLGPGITTHLVGGGELNGTITNQGLVTGTPTGTYYLGYYSSDLFTNAAGGTLDINSGTINLGGSWNNLGTVAVSGGVLNLSGTFTTPEIGTFTRGSAGTVFLTGTLNNTGYSVDLSATGPAGAVPVSGGTIVGGTLANSGANNSPVTSSGGSATLSGVTLDQDFTVSGETLFVDNGLTFQNGHTLTIGSASGSSLNFQNTQTFSGTGNLVFGPASGNYITNGTSATLTLGPGITTSFSNNSQLQANVTNQGTINLATASTVYFAYYNGETFTNAAGGTVNVSAGTLDIGGGQGGGAWHNLGAYHVTGGTLDLGGVFTSADLGTISQTSPGTVALIGTLNNAGTTLDLSPGGPYGSLLLNGTSISGGTITGSTPLTTGTGVTNTLTGVTLTDNLTVVGGTLVVDNGLTFQGAHSLTLTSSASLQAQTTGTISGPGSIIFAGAGSDYVQVSGANTVLTLAPSIALQANTSGQIYTSGNAQLINQGSITNLGSATSLIIDANLINQGTIANSAAGQTLTLGDYYGSTSQTNAGTITAAAGSTLTMNGPFTNNAGANITLASGSTATFGSAYPTTWNNLGTVTSTTATLNLGGDFTLSNLTGGGGTFTRSGGTVNIIGTLNNTGLTLNPSATGPAGVLVLSGGTILNGTIGGGAGMASNSSGGTLDGVTLATPFSVSGNLYIKDGLTFTGDTTLSMTSGAEITAVGVQTFNGPGEIVASGPGTDYLLVQSGGALTLSSGITFHVLGDAQIDGQSGSTLVNNGQILDQQTGSASTLSIDVNLTNNNTIATTASGQSVAIGDYYGSTSFTNAAGGMVNLVSGSTGTFNGPFTNAAGATINIPGTATATFGSAYPTTWSNAGTVNLTGGTLNLGGTFSLPNLTGGTFNRSGGTVNIVGTLNNTGLTLDPSASGPAGVLVLAGGTIQGGTVSGAAPFALTGSGTFNGVTLNTDMTLNGNLMLSNGLTIQNGHTLTLGVGGELESLNSGTIGGTGQITTASATSTSIDVSATSSTLTLGPGITLTDNGSLQLFGGGGSSLVNQGMVLLRGNASQLTQGIALTNDGVLDIGSGAIFYTGNANFTNPAGGTIRGSGTLNTGFVTVCTPTCVNVPQTLTNDGTIDPGSGAGGTGRLTIQGNLVMASGSTLHADLGGTTAGTYDQLAVTGNAQLGGTLQIAEQGATTVGGFFSQVGNAFPNLVTVAGTSSGALTFAPPADVTFTTQLSGAAVGISNTTQSITRFNSPTGGDWSNAADWTRGVPTSTSTVFIQEAGNPTITISSGSLTANSITGSNPIDITGGTLTLPASYTATGGTISLDGGTLVNNNVLAVGTTLNVNTGTISGSGTINLTGTLNHSGTGTGTIDETFNNQGSVVVSAGTLALAGDGTHSGSFALSSGATLDFAGGTQTVTSAGSLTGAGEMLVSGGTITMDGAYSLPGAPVQTGGVLVFNPTGTVTVPSYTATSGTVTWGNVDFTDYTNNGTAISNFQNSSTLGTMFQGGGTVNFSGTGNSVGIYNLSGGTVNSAGMAITGAGNFSGGTFNVLTGSTLNATGPITLNGASLNSTGTSTLSSLTLQTGGVLTGSGTIDVANLSWSGTGTVSGTGLLNVTNSLFLSGAAGGPGQQIGRTITNSGTATESGNYYVLMTGNAVFNNSGSFTISDNSTYGGAAGSAGNGTFNNSGSFTKSGGTNTTLYDTVFNNTGTVNVNAGTLVVPNGGTDSGAVVVAAGTTLTLENQQPTWGTGTVALATGSGFSGAGTVTVQSGVALNGTTTVAAGTTLNLAGATLSGTGKLQNAGTVDLNGTTIAGTVANSGTLDVNGSSTLSGATFDMTGGTLTIAAAQTLTKSGGAFDWSAGTIGGSGHLDLTGGASLALSGGTNTLNGPSLSVTGFSLPSGTLTLQGTSTLTVAGASSIAAGATLNVTGTSLTDNGTLTNAGTLNLTNATLAGTGALTNNGTMAVSGGSLAPALSTSGTLNFTGGTTTFAQALSETGGLVSLSGGNVQGNVNVTGGLLRGTGTITGNVDNISGNISPGFSPGQINIVGNLTLGSGSTMTELITGTTPGTLFDVVTVTGTATLNGTLNITLGTGYTPASGSTYQYLTYGSSSGAFATINQPSGFTFNNQAAANAAVLAFGASTTPSSPTPPVVVTPPATPPSTSTLPDGVSTQLQTSVTALNDATSATSPEQQDGGTGAAAGGGSDGTAASASANSALVGVLGDPLAALQGFPGLMVDPTQPFVGHPANLNACTR